MSRSIFSLLFMLLLQALCAAQVSIHLQSVPDFYTPLFDDIYIAGTFNNWNPADPAYKMQANPNGTYTVNIPGTVGVTVEYKFTRGSWTSVETYANGAIRPNRSISFSNGLAVYDIVENWEDMLGPHTAVGNTRLISTSFYLPQFNRSRRVWVYLPQNYFNSTDSFPVMYMHDGQNLFDAIYSFSGEWQIDESMLQLENEGQQPAIIVAVDNGGANRIDEYTPWVHTTYGGGDGDIYLDFLVQTLKPFVDSNFRTLTDRQHTAIMGSSLGGLIAFYGALKYQNIFSKAGVFSPSFWFSNQVFSFVSTTSKQADMRIYMLAGAQESATMVSNVQMMYDTLLAAGFGGHEIDTNICHDGTHSEWFWRREFPNAYRWLFAQDTLTTTLALNIVQSGYFYYANGQLHAKASTKLDTSATLCIYNTMGQLLYVQTNAISFPIDIPALKNGIYVICLHSKNERYTDKISVSEF